MRAKPEKTQPSHHQSNLSDGEGAYLAANYTRCLELLSSRAKNAEHYLLGAKALSRLGRYAEALAQLRDGEHECYGDYGPEADAQSALLHQIEDRERESRAFLERIPEKVLNQLAPGRQVDVVNRMAHCAWMRGDIHEAERLLERVRGRGDENQQAYNMMLQAWLEASRGNLEVQAALLLQAIELSLSAESPDIGAIASTLFPLANLCRELFIPDLFQRACELEIGVPWTENVRRFQFRTLRCLAWAHALQGSYIAGIRMLDKARDLAPTPFWRMCSFLDRAALAFASGEEQTAEASLLEARCMIDSVDWNITNDEEAMILLVAAELIAKRDPEAADLILDKYSRAKRQISRASGFHQVAVPEALECHARATVLFAQGRVSASRPYAKRAFQIFETVRYDWRASSAATLLYRSGAGDTWLVRAQERIANYPRSFLARDLAALGVVPVSPNLEIKVTPRKAEILKLLLSGEPPKGIARKLGISVNTVNVHLTPIYRKLGVKSRTEAVIKYGGKYSELNIGVDAEGT